MNLRAGEQTIEVFDAGRVTTHQSMVAEDPNVAALRDRFVWRFGDVVWIRQTLRYTGIEQL
ncbi:MAG: hypothetical protein ACF8AM_21595, partial [Rhodopirellula sp. JB055]|uniref:hypothetical protein n=1 Tax=Rhodopirellula sp. JB055 TaxID=3342846 RepID=UPI00370AFF37